jgi:hypothetical protein
MKRIRSTAEILNHRITILLLDKEFIIHLFVRMLLTVGTLLQLILSLKKRPGIMLELRVRSQTNQ